MLVRHKEEHKKIESIQRLDLFQDDNSGLFRRKAAVFLHLFRKNEKELTVGRSDGKKLLLPQETIFLPGRQDCTADCPFYIGGGCMMPSRNSRIQHLRQSTLIFGILKKQTDCRLRICKSLTARIDTDLTQNMTYAGLLIVTLPRKTAGQLSAAIQDALGKPSSITGQ